MVNWSRREFIISSSVALAGTLVPFGRGFPAAPASKGILLAPSLLLAPDGQSTLFSWVDLDSGKSSALGLPLQLQHSWIPYPGPGQAGIVPESGGPGVCRINVSEKTFAQAKTVSNDLVFGGHGDFSPDGSKLFLTQYAPDQGGAGSISIRDSQTLKEIGRFNSFGRFPHEMFVKENGKHLLVANLGHDDEKTGTPGAATFSTIETSSGKLLRQQYIASNLSLVAADKAELPQDLWEEASYYLQVVKVVQGAIPRAFVIHPHAKKISMWKEVDQKNRLERCFSFDRQPIAFCLTADRTRLAISLDDGSLQFLTRGTWRPNPDFTQAQFLRSTTHLFSL